MIIVDDAKLREVEQRLMQYPKKAPLVIARALNRAATNVRANASKKAREDYTVKDGAIKKTLKIKKASRNHLAAYVVSTGTALGLEKFRLNPKGPQHHNPPKVLKVRIKKSEKAEKLVGAFVADVNGDKVFRRADNSKHKRVEKGKWRELPIERLFGPSVPEILDTKTVKEFVEREAEVMFEARLDHEIQYVLEGH